MGKEVKITCDSCDCSMLGGKYFVLTIHKVVSGKKDRQPTIYLCAECFKKTKLAVVLHEDKE